MGLVNPDGEMIVLNEGEVKLRCRLVEVPKCKPALWPSLIADKAKCRTGLVTNSGQSGFDRSESPPRNGNG